MGREDIMGVLTSAARQRATVALSFNRDGETTAAEVEPYSVLKRSGVLTLFCWDTMGNRIVGLPVDKLVKARPTSHMFNPRYNIEL